MFGTTPVLSKLRTSLILIILLKRMHVLIDPLLYLEAEGKMDQGKLWSPAISSEGCLLILDPGGCLERFGQGTLSDQFRCNFLKWMELRPCQRWHRVVFGFAHHILRHPHHRRGETICWPHNGSHGKNTYEIMWTNPRHENQEIRLIAYP